MTLLMEEFLSGDRSVNGEGLAAAVFELAEQGALTISPTHEGVKLERRAQTIDSLTREQQLLRSCLFGVKETVTFSARDRKGSGLRDFSNFDQRLEVIALQDGVAQRLISSFRYRWALGAVATLSFGLAFIVMTFAPLIVGLTLLLLAGLLTFWLAAVLYIKTEAVESPHISREPHDESVISFLLWSHESEETARLQAAITDWTQDKDVRHPTWWKARGDWPGMHSQQILQAYYVLVQALSS